MNGLYGIPWLEKKYSIFACTSTYFATFGGDFSVKQDYKITNLTSSKNGGTIQMVWLGFIRSGLLSGRPS